ADHGRLVRGQVDRRQLELRRPDPVPRLVVEQRVVAADLDRHPERPQLVLVPFEGPLERRVAQPVVRLDRLPDLPLGDEPAGHQEADREVEDALGLAGGHERVRVTFVRIPVRLTELERYQNSTAVVPGRAAPCRAVPEPVGRPEPVPADVGSSPCPQAATPPARPVSCTWAISAPPCWPGCSPGPAGGRSCSGSRTWTPAGP